MKKIITALFFLLISISTFAQNRSERSVLVFEPHQLNQAKFTLKNGSPYFKAHCLGEILLENIEPFLAYSIVWYAKDWGENNYLKAIFHSGNHSLVPVHIEQEPHSTPATGQYISQLYFTEKNVQQIRLHYEGHSEIERIEVHFFNPGKTESLPQAITTEGGDRSACPCPQPAYIDRIGWCPDGTCPEDAAPAFTTVTHLIVHHSAGTNTSSDWSAVVRSIYDFHVFSNNWADIGYNWLVDPNGVIYQGRGDNVRGAHFCGNNTGTMGVCVMGDFTNIVPTGQAVGSLENLLAWKVCDTGIEANDHAFHTSSGMELQHISGHRDGCATACPGENFYPMLPTIRQSVQFKLDHECNGLFIAPPTNLDGTLVGIENNIQLTWDDNADNEDGYQVERSANVNNNFSVIANLPANAIEFVDEDFNYTTPYYYKVKATLGDSSSTYSNKFFIEPLTNSSPLLNENSVAVFPNPSLGKIQVVIENGFIGKMEMTTLDVLGQRQQAEIVFEKNARQVIFEVDLSGLPGGVYFLKIKQGEDVGVFQVLRL